VQSPPAVGFVDHALSARLEAAEAKHLELSVAALAERKPERSAAAIHVGGGVAAFLGPKVSISRAAGLGMRGPVSPDDLDRLEDFYRTRGMPAKVLLSPFADPSLVEALGERGFRLVELDSMLVRPIAKGEPIAAPAARIAIRVARRDEAAAWVRASLAGFSGSDGAPPPETAEIYETAFQVPTSTYFFATIDGEVAGSGALEAQGGAVHFFATSTRTAFRGQGVQSALFLARLAFAQAEGHDLGFLRTIAGSSSQRNAERAGFRAVYSRATLLKAFSG
jgi:ribosomal protein S18 acetylase RimI-like enzyme